MSKQYIMVAPNGARLARADHQSVPITLAQILHTAEACHQAGAQALHLHIRDNTGKHTLDAPRYRQTLDALRTSLPDLPVQITTEAAGIFDVETQLACLSKAKPKWASISVQEIARAPDLADRVYGVCAENGTKVQHILYSAEDAEALNRWQDSAIVRPDQISVIYVLGRYTKNRESSFLDLAPLRHAYAREQDWMVCAFGRQEHDILKRVWQTGGSLRVGFENSQQDSAGTLWADNESSVAALIASL